jgi:hypothetical protein
MDDPDRDHLPGYSLAVLTRELDRFGNKVEERSERREEKESDEGVIPVDTLTLPLLITAYRELLSVASWYSPPS